MKKALIFSPYLDTPGGGEVYSFNFAQCLQTLGYQVSFAWKDSDTLDNALSFLDIDIKDPNIDSIAHDLLTKKGKLLKKRSHLKQYDLVFFVSDGSLPSLSSKNNIIHFQVPYTNLSRGLLASLKLRNIHHIICNSNFTKTVIDRGLKVNSKVIHPPINFTPLDSKKENTILSVGRFTDTLHNKRQDVLIEAFRQLNQQGLKGWTLKLVGGASQKEAKQLISKLKKQAVGLPITFHPDLDITNLCKAYSSAKIFWHAAGFEVDETKHPEKVEHFGLSAAEAMAAGAVPIVVNKGGLKEIVEEGVNGYLFDDIFTLVSKTRKLINQPKLLPSIARTAKESSKQYSKENFCQNIQTII